VKNEEMSAQKKNSLATALKKRMETTEFSKVFIKTFLPYRCGPVTDLADGRLHRAIV